MTNIKQRTLGTEGMKVSALGLGCNRMSLKQDRDDKESIATIQQSIDEGFSLINTADFYGRGHNESIIGKAIQGRRDKVSLSVKCGAMFSPSGAFLGVDGRPNSVKNFANYSLQRLGVDVIDLYQPCRSDPDVPYEDTIGAIKDLIDEGKVRYLGVSEVGSDLLKRAHAVHPVSAIEIEYSLVCRFIENDILPTAKSLGVGVVPYRVLADGLLTGHAKRVSEEDKSAFTPPRLVGDNYDNNVQLIAELTPVADALSITVPQLTVAWLLTRYEHIVPIVGMTHRGRIRENKAIADIVIPDGVLQKLDGMFSQDNIKGERYAPSLLKFVAQ